MLRPWVCLLLIGAVTIGRVFTEVDNGSDEPREPLMDFWPDDYDDWYQDYVNNLGNNEEIEPADKDEESVLDNAENNNNLDFQDPMNLGEQEKEEDNIDMQIEREIQEVRGENDLNQIDEDYQIEDNRFEPKNPQSIETNNGDNIPKSFSNENDDTEQMFEETNFDKQDSKVNSEQNADTNVLRSEVNSNEDVLDGDILKGDDNDFDEDQMFNNDNEQNNMDEIVDETNKLLEETDSKFNENDETVNDDSVQAVETNQEKVIESPLAQSPYENEDKDLIEETLSLLNQEDKEENNSFEDEQSPDINQPNIDATLLEETNDLLEKLDSAFEDENQPQDVDQNMADDKPADDDNFKLSAELFEEEDNVDKIYEDLNDDLEKLLGTIHKLSKDEDGKQDQDWVLSTENDYELSPNSLEESINDNVLSDNTQPKEHEANYNDAEVDKMVEEIFGNKNEDSPADDTLKQENVKELPKNIVYTDDALNAEKDVETDEEGPALKVKDEDLQADSPVKYIDDLTRDEYDQLMEQFKILHKDELDTQSIDFDKNVAPVMVQLDVDTPVTITSPNYPGPYPTNNIIDWIFEGDGFGIELNITDFSINGIIGDYVLIKPGGVDASGSEGLVFTFRLNEERRYRFLDVDRMFVRFVANPGMSLLTLRGFQMSVRQVAHKIDDEENVADSEPVLPEVTSTHDVHLGISPEDFHSIVAEFRQVIADMATMYINANGIEAGLNTTLETARVLNYTVCNINWPDYEDCTRVRFGVPLVYEDEDEEPRLNGEDLSDMWERYSRRDPFSLRLRNLGIEEFPIPNDKAILAAWLVIASAVFVAMIAVSYALWRCSCFVGYTRMPTFNDTDSIQNMKQGLDMYPAPHQDLPPLYSENEYKWTNEDTTRVDMGGYANKSYARDDLYTLDSDEEVVNPRDSNNTNKSVEPRDVCRV